MCISKIKYSSMSSFPQQSHSRSLLPIYRHASKIWKKVRQIERWSVWKFPHEHSSQYLSWSWAGKKKKKISLKKVFNWRKSHHKLSIKSLWVIRSSKKMKIYWCASNQVSLGSMFLFWWRPSVNWIELWTFISKKNNGTASSTWRKSSK